MELGGKRKVKTRPKKPARGWGPFRSVLKERSVAFNLTLDVQNMRQDVANMATLRDLLLSKSLRQQHTADGSLMQVVREYFRVFRTGFHLNDDASRRLVEMDQHEQWAFLHSVMDEELDVGSGYFGPQYLGEQLMYYSTFVRFVKLELQRFTIVSAENSAVISTEADFCFQVRRSTIEHIFPHVLSNEALVSQLVGKYIQMPVSVAFYFNERGKCTRYAVDINHVSAFARIVTNPLDLNMMFGHALIADNWMLGIMDDTAESSSVAIEQPTQPDLEMNQSDSTMEWQTCAYRDHSVGPVRRLPALSALLPSIQAEQEGDIVDDSYPIDQASSSEIVHPSQVNIGYDSQFTSEDRRDGDTEFGEWALQIVRAYFNVFGSHPGVQMSISPAERNFEVENCEPQLRMRTMTGCATLSERWSSLRRCFEVLEFRATGIEAVRVDRRADACLIAIPAEYVLGITERTLELVFPYLVTNEDLRRAMANKVIRANAKLTFWVSKTSAKIQHINEVIGLEDALKPLLPCLDDLAFVMEYALISREGLLPDFDRELDQQVYETATFQFEVPSQQIEYAEQESLYPVWTAPGDENAGDENVAAEQFENWDAASGIDTTKAPVGTRLAHHVDNRTKGLSGSFGNVA